MSERTRAAQRDQEYSVAIHEHGMKQLKIETNILNMGFIVVAVQVGLRHPEFPPQAQVYVRAFLDAVMKQVGEQAPIIAQVWKLGNTQRQH
jgi:hypothetical protein